MAITVKNPDGTTTTGRSRRLGRRSRSRDQQGRPKALKMGEAVTRSSSARNGVLGFSSRLRGRTEALSMSRVTERLTEREITMASRKRTMWTRVAIVATLMISARLSALRRSDRAGARLPSQGAVVAAAGARAECCVHPDSRRKDLKAVLFNWAWYTGMLRSDQEYDLIMTLAIRARAPCKWADSLQCDDVPKRHQLQDVG